MEALDNPSYFSFPDENNVAAGGPRARDVAPELQRMRRSSETVVIQGQDAVYYNRRHSLATFPRTAVAKQVLVDKSGKMLDITIVSSSESEDATLWANYLISCFNEISREENKPPFKLARVMIENVLLGLPVEGSSGSRLQIVIVCPKFLRVISTCEGVPILASLLQPPTVLAMLLGVTNQALDNHQYSGLFRFEHWRKMTVKDKDKTFVGDFLGVAMDVLSRSWQLQQAMQQIKADSSRSHFSILPKKIKVGQNKILILLNDPLCNSDKISIFVERSGNGSEKMEVSSIKRRNPYTLQFSMPSVCLQTSQLVAVSIERNGRSIGHRLVKCECRLRELDQLLRSTDNPLAFMCQAIGINGGDRDQLDSFLVTAFQKNIPPNFNLLSPPSAQISPGGREEFPTLLHFAARFGLEKLCWQLVECPGGEGACQLKNCNQLSPADLAEKYGHVSLAHSLSSYMKMTELSTMYTYMNAYLKTNSSNETSSSTQTNTTPQDLNDGNYLLPRPLSDTYLVPPKARPVTPIPLSPVKVKPPGNLKLPSLPLENYQSPPQARPFTPSTPSTPTDHFSSYLHMHSPMSDTSSTNFDSMLTPEKKYLNPSLGSSDSVSIASSGGHLYMNTRGSSVCSKLGPDEELAEIINDFKNNVYTISELEKLVEAWKNRNDVQQSFREKKEQINQMREEYERIQQKMKEHLRRPTPFDRIKKFFSRKSKHETCERSDKRDVCHRPVSSLSLHSSSSSTSSGRMSTTSGMSVGDSGTHSDQEERKSDVLLVEKVSSPSPAFYERIQRQDSLPDDYVRPTFTYNTEPLPQPPLTLRRTTIVDVHRSDILEESQEENSDQTVKTVNGSGNQFESSKDSDSSENTYVNTSTVLESSKFIESKEATTQDELKILEQSEKLLKDMADGLSSQGNEDFLSPPESAFINGESIGENEEDTQNGDLDDSINESEVKDDVSELNIYREGVDWCSEKEKTIISLQDELQKTSIFNNNLHEYINVTSYLPPPIPPRSRYKNVIL